jgi:hypothetical protein
MSDKPIFRDARSAVLFALNYRNEQFAMSTLARMAQDGAIGSGAGLFGLDGSAMAGMLRARLERLQGHQSAALIARCADVDSAPWRAAVSEVIGPILTTDTGRAIDFEVLNSAVRKHFGERQTVQRIAYRAGLHRVTANRQLIAIRPDLERLEAQAWAEWDSSLRAACLI